MYFTGLNIVRSCPAPCKKLSPRETTTMVTPSGHELTGQIKMYKEDISVQETNPATPGQIVFMKFSIPLKK